jgi:hypothetical protein
MFFGLGHVGRQMIRGSAGAPSLDISFGGPTLDPRLTFTRASTATYFNATGTMQTAATNAPRFDYDPVTHVLRGLLIEESRVNYLLQSGNLSAAPWTSGSAFGPPAPVVTGNNAVAPDGTTTAARIDLPACSAGGLIQVYQNSVLTAASTFSIYLRGAVGGEQTYVIVSGTTYASLRVTLTTAWQRFVVVAPAFGGGANLLIGTDLRDGAQTATPAGTIYAWGAQQEPGAFATSYIPTTAAVVTRSQDQCVIPQANMGFFVAPGGSWSVEFIDFYNSGTSTRILWSAAGGSPTPMYLDPANHLSQYDVAGIVSTANAITLNVVQRGATTWAPGAAKNCLNGDAVATTATMTAGFAALATANLYLLQGNIPAEAQSGYIRHVRYWPRVLSNSELQAVTMLDPPTLDLVFSGPTLDPRITFARASTATYFDSSGVIQTAATNAPRFDYDPVMHVLNGLLIEEQRTNITLQSADVSNVVWNKQDLGSGIPVVTANQTAAPDGTVSAGRVVFPVVSGNGGSVIAQTITVTANPYSFTAWMRGNVGGEQVYLMITPDGLLYYRMLATLTTAWQRFTLSTPALPAGAVYPQIGIDKRDASQINTPAQTIYVWGAQIEQGAFPTSYIATTAAAVTRSADSCTMLTSSFVTNALSFSYAVEGLLPTSGAGPIWVELDDGTAANRSLLTTSTINLQYFQNIGGVTTTNNASLGNITPGAVFKSAVSTASTQHKYALNGAVSAPDPNAANPPPVTTLGIGRGTYIAGSSYIRRVRYWSRALSNSELQSVTT